MRDKLKIDKINANKKVDDFRKNLSEFNIPLKKLLLDWKKVNDECDELIKTYENLIKTIKEKQIDSFDALQTQYDSLLNLNKGLREMETKTHNTLFSFGVENELKQLLTYYEIIHSQYIIDNLDEIFIMYNDIIYTDKILRDIIFNCNKKVELLKDMRTTSLEIIKNFRSEKETKTIQNLTWAIIVLTFILVIIALIQYFKH